MAGWDSWVPFTRVIRSAESVALRWPPTAAAPGIAPAADAMMTGRWWAASTATTNGENGWPDDTSRPGLDCVMT